MPSHRPSGPQREPYLALKKAASVDLGSSDTSKQLLDLVTTSLRFLQTSCTPIDLISLVPGKRYFAYALKANTSVLSRPVNKDLFLANENTVVKNWKRWSRKHPGKVVGPLTYTMASAYCAASDLFDRNNKKGPATYFECLIGHLFARELRVNPTKRVSLPLVERPVRMTMDFIFDLGEDQPKVHLPVKMSTRERVVQAWSHQRLLDAAYGHAKYRAILVIHSETKLDLQTRQVVEICVPDQWLAYQTFLAKMDRIYYLDIPERYAQLAKQFPIIPLKPFADFFTEKEAVLSAPLV